MILRVKFPLRRTRSRLTGGREHFLSKGPKPELVELVLMVDSPDLDRKFSTKSTKTARLSHVGPQGLECSGKKEWRASETDRLRSERTWDLGGRKGTIDRMSPGGKTRVQIESRRDISRSEATPDTHTLGTKRETTRRA